MLSYQTDLQLGVVHLCVGRISLFDIALQWYVSDFSLILSWECPRLNLRKWILVNAGTRVRLRKTSLLGVLTGLSHYRRQTLGRVFTIQICYVASVR